MLKDNPSEVIFDWLFFVKYDDAASNNITILLMCLSYTYFIYNKKKSREKAILGKQCEFTIFKYYITVNISSLKIEEVENMAFNERVDASRSFRLVWIASNTGTSWGSDNVSNNGPIAPEATTEATFSSLPK